MNSELFETIRHIAEVIGMLFLPLIGWMLLTLINHSRKIIVLEERVNETIIHRLSELENHFDRIDGKVDQISENVKENRAIIQQRDAKLNEILHEIKNLKKN